MAEPNQVEAFDPSKLMQGVKDRIKATFVSLIPDDRWEGMIQNEIDAFFNLVQTVTVKETEKMKPGTYNATKMLSWQANITPFRHLVWEHCMTLTLEFLKEKVTMDYFKGVKWSEEYKVDEDMKKVIEEIAPMAAMKFFQAMVFNATQDLRNMIPGVQQLLDERNT